MVAVDCDESTQCSLVIYVMVSKSSGVMVTKTRLRYELTKHPSAGPYPDDDTNKISGPASGVWSG